MERRLVWRCLRTGLLSYALGVRPNMINGRILSLSGANRHSYWWRKRLKGLSHGIVIGCDKAEIKRKNIRGWSGALEIDAALYNFIIHPVLFILCSSMWKELYSSFHPSCIYNYLSIESLVCYVWEHVQYLWVIYSKNARQSVLCYLFYARLIRVWHVVVTFHLIIGYMCNV